MGELNLDAALIAGRGNVLTAAVSPTLEIPTLESLLAYAADYSTPPPGWTTIGHTDPEDLPEWDTDGGDSEVLRTWELLNAREVQEPETSWFVVKPLQHDNATMRLWLSGGTSTASDRFTAPVNKERIELAALIVYIDGGNVVGEVLERTSVRSEGARENAIDDWSKIPLRFTRLAPETGGSGYHWIGEHFGTDADGGGPTPTPWVAETAYDVGDQVSLTTGETLGATQAGTSGTEEPVAPTAGNTVTDGTVIWELIAA